MEQGLGTHPLGLGLELSQVWLEGVLKVLEGVLQGVKVAVDQRCVGQAP